MAAGSPAQVPQLAVWVLLMVIHGNSVIPLGFGFLALGWFLFSDETGCVLY